MKKINLLILMLPVLLFSGCNRPKEETEKNNAPKEKSFFGLKIPFAPRHYICYRSPQKIKVDGIINEQEWGEALWTEYFTDIEGSLKPAPRYHTRVKMLWDDDHLYIAAELEEPDIWATLHQRDTVIFYDNDFEVFIDPDGDTHQYYEYEMNALATYWDLMLIKPYRDGGPPVNGWDIRGLQTATHIYGTINHPGDKDEKWTLEIAMPLNILRECAPKQKPPVPGDIWRIDFSRVEWETEVRGGKYVVRKDTAGKRLPENNWVWSPQGIINMHAPETWGFLLFSGHIAGTDHTAFEMPADEQVKWTLRNLYYKEKRYFNKTGRFTSSLEELQVNPAVFDSYKTLPDIQITDHLYEITLPGTKENMLWHIRQDGLTWKTEK
ncbi:MAG: carbohydrate-binding family 9-like protein [Bacteroidales bacterium]|nr:carbohydrate-binding family 9-like protein [Bacteroidales bacterium]